MFALCLCGVSFLAANLWHTNAAAQPGKDLDRFVSATGKDSNPGSMRLPWATIQNAANHAQPGMTIHVAPGTYKLSATIASKTSGTSSSRIRYVSDRQWAAKILSSADPIWDNDGAYVDIVGFDISGGGTSYTGIHSQGSYDRSIGNRIHDFGSTGCMPGAGVMIGGGATNQSAIGNMIYNIGPLPPAVPGCNLIHGIYVATANCTVVNNVTFNNAGKGIQLWGTPAECVVANNTSFHNQDGMVLGNDGAGGSSLDNSIVANNIAYDNVRYGLYESGSLGAHNQYLNNLISSNCTDAKACDDPRTQVHMIAGRLINTVNADPQFVNGTGGVNGDYHLAAGSPAIHRGTTLGAPETDFDGNRRAAVPDIGAYQSEPVPASARTSQAR